MKLMFRDAIIKGKSFGSEKNIHGEVVFNTAMSGYVETLTDPSYYGQILVLTYPLQGNYGVPDINFESERIQVAGLVVSHYSENPSHYTQKRSLGDWLKSQNIPAMCDIDTRTLTRYLREHGTAPADFLSDDYISGDEIVKFNSREFLSEVVSEKTVRYGKGDTKVLFIDTGAKENIVRCLVNRGASVIRAPWNTDWEKYLPEVDGVFIANGPGDPMDALNLIERVREVLFCGLPFFGICFGNQLISLAAGARTIKMKYGHRSVNQPVRSLLTGKCYITSQNHGYVVQNESLPHDWEPWFVNLNDGTNEGIRHKTKPIRSVQFHPEARPGTNDTAFLFDDFLTTVNEMKKERKASDHIEKLEIAEIVCVA